MRFIVLLCWALITISCKNVEVTMPATKQEALFELLSPDSTGLSFENTLMPTSELNIFSYMYFYNGGGVGVADLNNDALIDIVFTGSQVPNQIYINKGNLKFQSIDLPPTTGWTNGVSFVDINSDGLLDIYFCQVNNGVELQGQHRLLVCKEIKNSIPIYEESAASYGLDFKVYGTQSAFFDFDLDGDLDLFLLNHSVHKNGTFGDRRNHLGKFHAKSGDRLLKNENGRYLDITKTCGIQSTALGYGLGVKIADINLDGWPDIYVGNDFHENDYLYINQRNGTFIDQLDSHIMHTSRYTMGVDIADFNNDLYPDIFTLDMLPNEYSILKRSEGEDLYNIYSYKLSLGYNQQYSRNTLQLNRKNGFFSEIGTYSGVHASDWSWSTFFADLDNDGWKDLFISNGIPRRMNDIDYIDYIVDDVIQTKIREKKFDEADLSLVGKLPEIKIKNKFYLNNKDFTFMDAAPRVQFDKAGFSNGAVYADLDNDGDLEIVTNNINDKAFIYKNLSVEKGRDKLKTVLLKGPDHNSHAIGAKIISWMDGKASYIENFHEKGFQSSVHTPLYLSGSVQQPIDSLFIIWPNNMVQKILLVDSTLMEIKYDENKVGPFNFNFFESYNRDMVPVDVQMTPIKHTEHAFPEFDREALMPYMTSTEGPAFEIGDINNDSLDDFYLGGSRYHSANLFLGKKDGGWQLSEQAAFKSDSMYEDICALFCDFDGDTDLDLVVGSGGNEFFTVSEYNVPRLYANDGKGNFERKREAFQLKDQITASVLLAKDFNADGQADLFIGARSIPWAYGKAPNSKIFINQQGVFIDQTDHYLENYTLGMVKDAQFADINNDGNDELLLAAEWEGIKILELINTKYREKKSNLASGLWNSVDLADMDKDGDLDIVAGNFGLNSKWKASKDKPLRMYYDDFDKNDRFEQAITYYYDTKEVPFAGIKELHKQMPSAKKKYQYATDFAKMSIYEVFGKLNTNVFYEVNQLASVVFENQGNYQFKTHLLPPEAQWSCIKDVLIKDINEDGLLDVLPVSNYFDTNTQLGRFDADPGIVLINRGAFNFQTYTYKVPIFSNQTRRIRQSNSLLFGVKNNSSLSISKPQFKGLAR